MKRLDPKLRAGLAVVLLGLSYALGSRALDTGSYWEYLGSLVALVFGIKFIVHAVHNQKYGKKV